MEKTLKQSYDEINEMLKQTSERRQAFFDAAKQLKDETEIITDFLQAFSELQFSNSNRIMTTRKKSYNGSKLRLIKEGKITCDFIKMSLEQRVQEKFVVEIKFEKEFLSDREFAVITVSLI